MRSELKDERMYCCLATLVTSLENDLFIQFSISLDGFLKSFLSLLINIECYMFYSMTCSLIFSAKIYCTMQNLFSCLKFEEINDFDV